MLTVLLSHLAPFSYLNRGVTDVVILIWCCYRIRQMDPKLETFTWANIRRAQLRTYSSLLVLLSLMLMLLYDGLLTVAKYKEGWSIVAGIAKLTPKANYSNEDFDIVVVSDAIFGVALSLKASATFLMLATFNHVFAARLSAPFMGTVEFRAYRIYSIVSLCLYPAFQAYFAYNELLTTIAPQFVYHTECALIVALLFLTNCRLSRLLRSTEPRPANRVVSAPVNVNNNTDNANVNANANANVTGDNVHLRVHVASPPATVISGAYSQTRRQLHYFERMNMLLAVFVALDFIGLFSINADLVRGIYYGYPGVSVQNTLIYPSLFATDIMTAVFSLGFSFGYVAMVFILYPDSFTNSNTTLAFTSHVGTYDVLTNNNNNNNVGRSVVRGPNNTVNHMLTYQIVSSNRRDRRSTNTNANNNIHNHSNNNNINNNANINNRYRFRTQQQQEKQQKRENDLVPLPLTDHNNNNNINTQPLDTNNDNNDTSNGTDSIEKNQDVTTSSNKNTIVTNNNNNTKNIIQHRRTTTRSTFSKRQVNLHMYAPTLPASSSSSSSSSSLSSASVHNKQGGGPDARLPPLQSLGSTSSASSASSSSSSSSLH